MIFFLYKEIYSRILLQPSFFLSFSFLLSLSLSFSQDLSLKFLPSSSFPSSYFSSSFSMHLTQESGMERERRYLLILHLLLSNFFFLSNFSFFLRERKKERNSDLMTGHELWSSELRSVSFFLSLSSLSFSEKERS